MIYCRLSGLEQVRANHHLMGAKIYQFVDILTIKDLKNFPAPNLEIVRTIKTEDSMFSNDPQMTNFLTIDHHYIEIFLNMNSGLGGASLVQNKHGG